jgi:hypothetical protein
VCTHALFAYFASFSIFGSTCRPSEWGDAHTQQEVAFQKAAVVSTTHKASRPTSKKTNRIFRDAKRGEARKTITAGHSGNENKLIRKFFWTFWSLSQVLHTTHSL